MSDIADPSWPSAFWTEVDRRAGGPDALEHPFYERWSAGELTRAEIAAYASEYDHAVVATADASRRAAGPDGGSLDGYAEEEDRHTALWRSFAAATGWGCATAWYYGEDPLPETVECVRVWGGDAGRGLAEDLVTLYAIESAQARVSRLELDGLLRHYGFAQGPATEYPRLHALGDGRASMLRAALAPLLAGRDPAALLEQVESVHSSHWALLDGVEALARRGRPADSVC